MSVMAGDAEHAHVDRTGRSSPLSRTYGAGDPARGGRTARRIRCRNSAGRAAGGLAGWRKGHGRQGAPLVDATWSSRTAAATTATASLDVEGGGGGGLSRRSGRKRVSQTRPNIVIRLRHGHEVRWVPRTVSSESHIVESVLGSLSAGLKSRGRGRTRTGQAPARHDRGQAHH